MNKNNNTYSKFYSSIRNSIAHNSGLSSQYQFAILYFITCLKEGADLQIIHETSSMNKDLELFENKTNQLELSYVQTRLVLRNVPLGKEFLVEVNTVFDDLLRSLPRESFDKFRTLAPNRDKELENELLNYDFAIYFDILLEQIVSYQTKKSGEFILPSQLGEFLTKLVQIPDDADVFNPFAGLATFGIYLEGNQKYHGQEIDRLIWAVSMLRLNAHDRLRYSNFQNTDTFLSWPNKKYDLIITNPPFRLRLNLTQQIQFDNTKMVEHLILREGLELLKNEGKIVCTIPLSFLSASGTDYKIRKRLIDADILETVISFPGGLLMQTNIPFAVLVINRNKNIKNHVSFFDGSKHVIKSASNRMELNVDKFLDVIHYQLKHGLSSKHLGPSGNILERDITLHESVFIHTERLKIAQYNLVRERYELDNILGVELGEVIRLIPNITKGKVESDHLNDFAYEEDPHEFIVYPVGKLIRIRDLKIIFDDPILDINTLKSEPVLQHKNISFIQEDAILVALIGKHLKPTIVDLKGQLVALNNNILAFQVNEELVNKEWFINQLKSLSISKQHEMLRTGSTIPYLKKDDFLKFKMQIPSLKEQRQAIDQTKGLFKKIDALESDIIQQNAYLRHTLAGPVADLLNAIKNIDGIISKISEKKLLEIKKIKLSDDHLYNLGQYLADSKKNIELVVSTVKGNLNVYQELKRAPLERIDFLSLVEKYAERKRTNTLNYEVDFDFDKDVFTDNKGNINPPKIRGNSKLIRSMLDNLLENAEKHGFNYDGNDRFELYITANLDFDNPNDRTVVLIVANTGNPMEHSLKFADLIQKGASYGKGAGEGFGLWYVDQIVRKHNGDWYLISDTLELDKASSKGTEKKSDLATIFQFEFPFID